MKDITTKRDSSDEKKTTITDVKTHHHRLQWSGITYQIPLPKQSRKSKTKADIESGKDIKPTTRTILDGLNGHVDSGEIVAILGASGAGKTTLLNILSSRLDSTGTLSGEVTFNGADRRAVNWKRTLGFVEQDDLLYGQLTVTETLDYSAQLRLPTTNYTLAEKRARVAETIEILRLEKCAGARIGDGETRGVSGGERKRVAIGQELVSDVRVLMLDEPTSGLDSFSALNLIQNLREIAKKRDVVCLMTIHQPSWEIFSNFTRVILMTRGKVFYEGPPSDALNYFTDTVGLTVPRDVNPSDWFLTISENYEKSEAGEDRVQKLITTWQSFSETNLVKLSPTHPPTLEKEQWAVSWFHELALLTRRNYQQIARNPKIWIGSFAQNIVLLILIGFAFFRRSLDQGGVISRLGVLFFIPINNSFSAVFPILTVFPSKRAMSIRERAAGMYRCSSFYLSNVIVEIPSQVAQRALFIIVVYWMIGLKEEAGAFFIWLLVNFVQLLSAVGLGFLIGAGATNVQAANALAPLANVIFLLFGGNLLPLNDIPKYFIWLHWMSPITYAFQALSLNEFSGLNFSCPTGAESSTQCYRTGQDVLRQYALQRFSVWENVGFLCVISFVFGSLGFLCLRFLGRPSRRFT